MPPILKKIRSSLAGAEKYSAHVPERRRASGPSAADMGTHFIRGASRGLALPGRPGSGPRGAENIAPGGWRRPLRRGYIKKLASIIKHPEDRGANWVGVRPRIRAGCFSPGVLLR